MLKVEKKAPAKAARVRTGYHTGQHHFHRLADDDFLGKVWACCNCGVEVRTLHLAGNEAHCRGGWEPCDSFKAMDRGEIHQPPGYGAPVRGVPREVFRRYECIEGVTRLSDWPGTPPSPIRG